MFKIIAKSKKPRGAAGESYLIDKIDDSNNTIEFDLTSNVSDTDLEAFSRKFGTTPFNTKFQVVIDVEIASTGDENNPEMEWIIKLSSLSPIADQKFK